MPIEPEIIDVGNLVQVTARFRFGDVLVDPEDITFTTRSPSNVVREYKYGVDDWIVRISDGLYGAGVDANEHGKWYYRWTAEGGNFKGAMELGLIVRKSHVLSGP